MEIIYGHTNSKFYLVTGGTPRLRTSAPNGYIDVEQTAIDNGGKGGGWRHLNPDNNTAIAAAAAVGSVFHWRTDSAVS